MINWSNAKPGDIYYRHDKFNGQVYVLLLDTSDLDSVSCYSICEDFIFGQIDANGNTKPSCKLETYPAKRFATDFRIVSMTVVA